VSPPPIPPKRPELTGQRVPLPRPPTLPRVDPDSDPVPEEMTAEERARSSYTMLLGLHQQFPKVSEKVENLRVDVDSLTRFTHTHIDRLDRKIDGALNVRTPSSFPPEVQQYIDQGIAEPSPSGHDLKVGVAEYVKVHEEKIQGFRERDSLRVQMQVMQQDLDAEKLEKKFALARAEGAESVYKRLVGVLKIVAIIVPLIALLGGFVWELAVLTRPPTPPPTTHSP
jgi:hypothetical protein